MHSCLTHTANSSCVTACERLNLVTCGGPMVHRREGTVVGMLDSSYTDESRCCFGTDDGHVDYVQTRAWSFVRTTVLLSVL